jgi:hypothetical protein
MRPGVEGRRAQVIAWVERCPPCGVIIRRAPGSPSGQGKKKGKPRHRQTQRPRPSGPTKAKPMTRAERQRAAALKNQADDARQYRRRPNLEYDRPGGKSGAS